MWLLSSPEFFIQRFSRNSQLPQTWSLKPGTKKKKVRTNLTDQRDNYTYLLEKIHTCVRAYSLIFLREILIIIQFINFTVQLSMKNPVGEFYYKMAYFLCTKFDYNYVCLWSPWEKLSPFGKTYSIFKNKRKNADELLKDSFECLWREEMMVFGAAGLYKPCRIVQVETTHTETHLSTCTHTHTHTNTVHN